MPARVERSIRRGGSEFQLIGEPTGEFYEVVMFFGIIDILQDYDISKKLEHAYKSIQYDPTSISAVDPRQYSRRFRDFIFNIFLEDELWKWSVDSPAFFLRDFGIPWITPDADDLCWRLLKTV